MFGKKRVSLPHIDRTSRLGAVCPPCHHKPYVWQDDVRPAKGCTFGGSCPMVQCLPRTSMYYPEVFKK
jgi:hypothetical protein